jgi:hypothetical protein
MPIDIIAHVIQPRPRPHYVRFSINKSKDPTSTLLDRFFGPGFFPQPFQIFRTSIDSQDQFLQCVVPAPILLCWISPFGIITQWTPDEDLARAESFHVPKIMTSQIGFAPNVVKVDFLNRPLNICWHSPVIGYRRSEDSWAGYEGSFSFPIIRAA